MTQADVDAARDRGGENITSSSSPSPVVSALSSSKTQAPTVTPDASNRSGLVASGSGKPNSAAGGVGDNAGSSAVVIALACFVIGALVGGIPAMMYFRSFRYEAMRGGGHSYEMT